MMNPHLQEDFPANINRSKLTIETQKICMFLPCYAHVSE